jgi:hypothetical protein
VLLNGNVCFESGDGTAVSFRPAGEPFAAQGFLSAVYERLGMEYRKFYKMDVLSKLGFLASELVLNGIEREQPQKDTGIVFFNRSASLETDRRYRQTICDKDNFYPSPSEFVYTLPNIVAGEISIRNRIYGETTFYITPHFRGDDLCEAIENTVNFAGMKHVLAGWVEADAFSGDLDCLMVLCETGNVDGLPLTGSNLEALYAESQDY